jgi:hypothetical protein
MTAGRLTMAVSILSIQKSPIVAEYVAPTPGNSGGASPAIHGLPVRVPW